MKKINNKVLIVEDDVNIRDIYSLELQSGGFEVITAENGEEGLKKSIAETPDLILLDIQMPVMDGLTMLQHLRKESDYGKKVPVILLTNLSANEESIIKKVVETEPSSYMVKVNTTALDLIKKVKEKISVDK